jgi:DNA-binding MarR family transcriptional regulator
MAYKRSVGLHLFPMIVSDPQTPLRPSAAPPRELLSSTAFLLKRVGWTAKERAFEAFEPTGLSPYHHAVLAFLDEAPPKTQGAIADALRYDRSQLVGWLDELEERGLIARRRDPADRRRHLVTLTPEGKKELQRLRAIVRRLEEELLAPLDARQRETLHALLLELAGHHDPRCASAGSAATP